MPWMMNSLGFTFWVPTMNTSAGMKCNRSTREPPDCEIAMTGDNDMHGAEEQIAVRQALQIV